MFHFLKALLLQPKPASALTVPHPTSPQHLHLCLEPFSLLKYPRNPCCSLLPCWAPLMDAIFHQWTWWYQLNTSNFTSAEILTPGKWSLVWGGNCSAQGTEQMPNPAANQVSLPCSTSGSNLPADLSPAAEQQAGTAVLEAAPVRAPCFGFHLTSWKTVFFFLEKLVGCKTHTLFFSLYLSSFKLTFKNVVLPKPAPS